MSPQCHPVAKRDSSPMTGKEIHAGSFQFGIRKQENGVNSPLKVSKDSHRIRKPPLPLPQVQYRPPIIIHTYSPKVIHTDPDDFMSLVQKLTGSSDTRLRLKKSPTKKEKSTASLKEDAASSHSQSAGVANLERQGSGSSASSSEDSAFLVSDNGEAATMKQSNSPRSPLDSSFEFDNVNESMFSHFDTSAVNPFSQVKAEPVFSFNENNPFSFFADFLQPPSRLPLAAPMPLSRQEMGVVDHMHSSLPSAAFLSPNLMTSLPDLSPSWSQPFVDCLSAPSLGCQAPYQRQRFSGGYSPSPESSTMVALENIHAFMLT